MVQEKVRGDCTMTATLLATVFKSLGIPTRIVLSIPIADANSPENVKMAETALKHPVTKSHVLKNLKDNAGMWQSHTFNEVYIGGQWVRLNYNDLGQEVVDSRYLGLMVQVGIYSDWSEAGLSTWGIHATNHRLASGFSVNPYHTVQLRESITDPSLLSDHIGEVVSH